VSENSTNSGVNLYVFHKMRFKIFFVWLIPVFLISSGIVFGNMQTIFALTPVSDLTGAWSGFGQFDEISGCQQTVKLNANIKQNENEITGTYSFVSTGSKPLKDNVDCSDQWDPTEGTFSGTLDGSRISITLSDDGLLYTGWYANSGIKLSVQSDWLTGTIQLSPTNFSPPAFNPAKTVDGKEVKKKEADTKDATQSASLDKEVQAKKLAEEAKKKKDAEAKKLALDEANKKKEESKKLAEETKKKKDTEAKKLAQDEANKKKAESKKLDEEVKKKETANVATKWDKTLSTLHEQEIPLKAKVAGKILQSEKVQKILLPMIGKDEGSTTVALFKYYSNGPEKSDLAKEDYIIENIPSNWKEWIIKETKGMEDGRHNLSPYYSKIKKSGGPDDLVYALGHFDVTVITNADGTKTYDIEDLYSFGFDLTKKFEEQRHGFHFETQNKEKLDKLKWICSMVPKVAHPTGNMEGCEVKPEGSGYKLYIPQTVLSAAGKPFLVKGEFTK
jgi:flagellar biosynthesis GTPase FlhF